MVYNTSFAFQTHFRKFYEDLMVHTMDAHTETRMQGLKRMPDGGGVREREKTENVRTEMEKKDGLILPLVVAFDSAAQAPSQPVCSSEVV